MIFPCQGPTKYVHTPHEQNADFRNIETYVCVCVCFVYIYIYIYI